jgi:predicted thioredoxin/glutaredoxin
VAELAHLFLAQVVLAAQVAVVEVAMAAQVILGKQERQIEAAEAVVGQTMAAIMDIQAALELSFLNILTFILQLLAVVFHKQPQQAAALRYQQLQQLVFQTQ